MQVFVYSKEILRFVSEITFLVRDTLAREVGLNVGRNRFHYKSSSYPIAIVIYSGKNTLGYFDPDFYELGFNECLMHTSKEQLHKIIRHEIAHYLTCIEHGSSIMPHGEEFKAFCKRIGWGEDIFKASICLEESVAIVNEKSSVLRKAEKLLALSTSSNKHEAELALLKSQELLLKHNLESVSSEGEEKIFFKRILKQKKVDSKMRSIAKILSTFFVAVVLHKGTNGTCLEILGERVNVEIAEYVAVFLSLELDNLWRLSSLKGLARKNSFFLGIAKGYTAKIQKLQEDYNKEVSTSLLVIEKKLQNAQKALYPRLSRTTSQSRHCHAAATLGEKMGKSLTINCGVTKETSFLKSLITFSK